MFFLEHRKNITICANNLKNNVDIIRSLLNKILNKQKTFFHHDKNKMRVQEAVEDIPIAEGLLLFSKYFYFENVSCRLFLPLPPPFPPSPPSPSIPQGESNTAV